MVITSLKWENSIFCDCAWVFFHWEKSIKTILDDFSADKIQFRIRRGGKIERKNANKFFCFNFWVYSPQTNKLLHYLNEANSSSIYKMIKSVHDIK